MHNIFVLLKLWAWYTVQLLFSFFPGGFSAGVTTPLDVAKTRIMLAESGSAEARGYVIETLKTVYAEKGVSGLFAGVTPRVTWISIGGCVFFGVYEFVAGKLLANKVPQNPQ